MEPQTAIQSMLPGFGKPCLSLGNKRVPKQFGMKPNKTGLFHLGLSLCLQFTVSLERESEGACGVVV